MLVLVLIMPEYFALYGFSLSDRLMKDLECQSLLYSNLTSHVTSNKHFPSDTSTKIEAVSFFASGKLHICELHAL